MTKNPPKFSCPFARSGQSEREADGSALPESATPLSLACGRERFRVCRIRGDRKLCARMAQMGVLPGSEIELLSPGARKQCMFWVKGGTVTLVFRRAIPLTGDVVVAIEDSKRSGYLDFGRIPYDLTNAGLYHISGYWVRKPEPRWISLFDKAGRGLIWATERDSRLYGLLASNGEWVVEPQYESVRQLYDERALVGKRVDKVKLSGWVDSTGQIVVPLQPLDVSNGQGRITAPATTTAGFATLVRTACGQS